MTMPFYERAGDGFSYILCKMVALTEDLPLAQSAQVEEPMFTDGSGSFGTTEDSQIQRYASHITTRVYCA